MHVHEVKFLTIRIRQIYPYDMSKGVWAPPPPKKNIVTLIIDDYLIQETLLLGIAG